MFKKAVLSILLLGLICLTVSDVSAKSNKNTSRLKRTISDNLIYALIFSHIDALGKKAEESSDEAAKIYLKNYFAKEAGLSEEQGKVLRVVAGNFINAFHSVSYREKISLSLAYRDELKKLFSRDDFIRFDAFVKSRFASGIKIVKSADGKILFGGSGSSSIGLDGLNRLHGASSTNFLAFARSPDLVSCSVSGSMSGPNVSESSSDSNSCGANLAVNMYSAEYLPDSQYCVNGTHVYADNPLPFSSACMTTATAPSKVIYVEFQQIATGDLPIDANPNVGGGRRIFPDKKNPTETVNRRMISVRAKIGANAAGERVYFRRFDPDDPSANAAPIDPETTTNAGDDNNGNVDGTSSTKSGQFSVSASLYDCEIAGATAACFTDSNGEAVVNFTVTMQPGDNFTVAASTDNSYLTGLVPAANGINLQDSSNNQIPVTTTANAYACAVSTINACRTDLLTVWRRLHIEVDSMGNVTGNKVEGTFPAIGKVGTGEQTLPVNVSSDLELNRFENGRIVIGSRTFRIINSNPDAIPPVNANTINTVTINNTGTLFGIAAGQAFTLYDDDDSNSDGVLDGDEGDDVDEPDEPDLGLLKSNDVACLNTHYTNDCNVLVTAYVRPVFDLTVSHENAPFRSNTSSRSLLNIYSSYFQNINWEASTDFWTIYIFGAYQFENPLDGDPDYEGGVYGQKDGPGSNDGQGAALFNEAGRPTEYENLDNFNPVGWRERPINRRFTIAHEVGHLFGGDHDDYNPGTMEAGVMGEPISRTSPLYSDTTINKIRGGTMLFHP